MTGKELILAMHQTFDPEAGQMVIAYLSDLCHENVPVHTPGDPYTTAYKDGMRSVMKVIREKLKPVGEESNG